MDRTNVTNLTNTSSNEEIQIGPFIIVNDRMCKILICECNSKNKKMYIRCNDVETDKAYSVLISKSLFLLENFSKGDCSIIVDCTLEHIRNCPYNFRPKENTDEIDLESPTDVTMYSAGGLHVVMGSYLKKLNEYYVILSYEIEKNKIYFKCMHIYTKHIAIYEITPPEKEKMFDQSFLFEFGSTVIDKNVPNYICCYDQNNNVVGFALKGMN